MGSILSFLRKYLFQLSTDIHGDAWVLILVAEYIDKGIPKKL